MPANILRNIPSVNDLLETPLLKGLVDRFSHHLVAGTVRACLDELRAELKTAAVEMKLPNVNDLAERIAGHIQLLEQSPLRPVINATGIMLHTGLGRAPLAASAVEAMVEVARDYASVEIDLRSGQRSHRVVAVEALLKQLTGAEAALVVNNNAGATMLTLATLAAGKEVIVSRGELIEIGGSFRLPDVMATSGATLKEVGTTNITRVDDYRRAITEQTAALMSVHTSNFRVVGFTASPSLEDLVDLGRSRGLPVIHDIGSGALIDFSAFGFTDEPVASESIRQGADLVLFSGDKLLGGPQCGIIIGKKALVDRIGKHPMTRALRVDKLTLAALAATLKLYRNPDIARREIPLLSFLSTPIENLKNRAERMAPQLKNCSAIDSAEAVSDVTFLGGGSIPAQQMPTWCVALKPARGSVDDLASALRGSKPGIVGRIQHDRLLFDLRTVFPRQDVQLIEALRTLSHE